VDEKPFSDMIRAKVANSKHSPSSIIPHRGKVLQHNAKSARPQLRGVFNKSKSRLDLFNDPAHLTPKAAAVSLYSSLLAVDVVIGPGGANVLAREPSAHDINLSAPWSAVESAYIIPDWELWQDSVALPLQ
jgi:hypothetical protein